MWDEACENDSDRTDDLDPLVICAHRWAVLTFIRDGLGGVRPPSVEDAEKQLDAWRKDAEL
jgi:hypothetical protein